MKYSEEFCQARRSYNVTAPTGIVFLTKKSAPVSLQVLSVTLYILRLIFHSPRSIFFCTPERPRSLVREDTSPLRTIHTTPRLLFHISVASNGHPRFILSQIPNQLQDRCTITTGEGLEKTTTNATSATKYTSTQMTLRCPSSILAATFSKPRVSRSGWHRSLSKEVTTVPYADSPFLRLIEKLLLDGV